MARLANCPHCNHELFVPDGADQNALAKCPACRAFFELKDVASRELSAVVLMEPGVPVVSDLKITSVPEEMSSAPTWNGDVPEHQPIAAHDSENPMPPAMEGPAMESRSEASALESAGHETPEEAAARIDQWFRSAKTLSDIPPLDVQPAAEQHQEEHVEITAPSEPALDAPPAEFGAVESRLPDFTNADAPPHDEPATSDLTSGDDLDRPAWDDSQHMDKLLADLQNQPIDTFEPSTNERALEPSADVLDDDQPEPEHEFQTAAATEWVSDGPPVIAPLVGKLHRKRSVVRMLVMPLVGGVIGLALGYYALLWIKGPSIDFLELAKYLPPAALPSSFHNEAKPSPPAPKSSMASDLAAATGKAADTTTNTPAAIKAGETASPASTPEKQAAFTTPTQPAATSKTAVDTDDRYAVPPKPNTVPAITGEPAPLDAPPAKAITKHAPASELPMAAPVKLANAPTFAASDVATSLQAANAAQAALATGNLSDGGAVARAKGTSYMVLADLAQKATLMDASSNPADSAREQQQADEFFRRTLADAHTRNEVAQIVPKWLAHPKRPQNGVFFAGNVTRVEHKGDVVEYGIEVGGTALTVVVPAGARKSTEPSIHPVGVAGWIADKPADQIPGYSGASPQVIFAQSLLTLE